ncbi:MAG: ThiF family adenylyltransferase [Alphaproteobacteria bacterium]|nr:ThiF family adenylyltransferase [Alphaproteobacteria bacterium]
MPLVHEKAIDQVLRALLQIVERNARIAGQDPVAARHRWVSGGLRAWSLLDVADRRSNATATKLYDRWVIAGTPAELSAWLEHRGISALAFVDALITDAKDFSEVPHDFSSLNDEQKKVVLHGGILIFVLATAAGPLLVAIVLESPHVIARLRVDRADRQWLHSRGGNGLRAEIANAHVALVGCGSLGGGVAELLARAGVGWLTIIDPDVVSWDNVARHALGGSAVERPKAVELARRLQEHIPTAPRIIGLAETWQRVAADKPEELRADAIVSTIASWPDELALAEWARNNSVRFVAGWVEGHAAAGHAVSLMGKCFACLFSPNGRFVREVARWEDESPLRLADGCHEHFLPFGYADVVATQGLIARLALEVLAGESTTATHRAIVPSAPVLKSLGAYPSLSDYEWPQRSTAWAEIRQEWPLNYSCWHCGEHGVTVQK